MNQPTVAFKLSISQLDHLRELINGHHITLVRAMATTDGDAKKRLLIELNRCEDLATFFNVNLRAEPAHERS